MAKAKASSSTNATDKPVVDVRDIFDSMFGKKLNEPLALQKELTALKVSSAVLKNENTSFKKQLLKARGELRKLRGTLVQLKVLVDQGQYLPESLKTIAKPKAVKKKKTLSAI